MSDFDTLTKGKNKEFPGGVRDADEQLDISGVVMPISLILCKSALSRLEAGKVLEVRLQDRDTLEDLILILTRSGDQILAWEQHQDDYCLWVRKGTGYVAKEGE